jgi:malonate transporter
VLLSLVVPYVNPDLLAALLRPVELVGNMAVPAMLIAFGISLRRGPRPGAGGSRGHVATLVGLKLVFQPVVAIAVGYAGVGLRGTALFAAAVTAALPTAQNVFTYANTYRRATYLARDAIFVSTFLSVPAILLIALFFRP